MFLHSSCKTRKLIKTIVSLIKKSALNLVKFDFLCCLKIQSRQKDLLAAFLMFTSIGLKFASRETQVRISCGSEDKISTLSELISNLTNFNQLKNRTKLWVFIAQSMTIKMTIYSLI